MYDRPLSSNARAVCIHIDCCLYVRMSIFNGVKWLPALYALYVYVAAVLYVYILIQAAT